VDDEGLDDGEGLHWGEGERWMMAWSGVGVIEEGKGRATLVNQF